MNTKTLIAQLEQTKDLSVEEFKIIYNMVEESSEDMKKIQQLLVDIMRGIN